MKMFLAVAAGTGSAVLAEMLGARHRQTLEAILSEESADNAAMSLIFTV
jgi:hypothetical protein